MKIIPPAREIYEVGEDGTLQFNPKYKIIVWKGGRGRGASHGFSDGLSIVGAQQEKLILCVREIQRSIRDSVHKLLKTKIISNSLDSAYRILERSIQCANGSEFIFSGLLGQEHTIRSLEGVNITYMEEAQKTSKRSFDSLIPTVTRTEGCQILIAYNPDSEDDPVEDICKRDDCLVVHSTIYDNPLAPQTLIDEADRCKRNDVETWEHVWMGGFNKSSNEMVFSGKCIQEYINPQEYEGTKYYGMDWGFGGHPSTFVECGIVDDDIVILDSIYWYSSDADTIAKDLIERHRENPITNEIWPDPADPQSGKILKTLMAPLGVNVRSKWGKDTIIGGVRWLRAHNRIVFNTHIEDFWKEVDGYRKKVDAKTGAVTNEIVDANNHGWDATRYAFHRLIKKGIL